MLNTIHTVWSHPMKISILESIHTTNIGQICRHNKWKIDFEYYNDWDHSNRFLIHWSSEIRCVLAFPSICCRWLLCYMLAKLLCFHWSSSFWIDRKNRNRYEFNDSRMLIISFTVAWFILFWLRLFLSHESLVLNSDLNQIEWSRTQKQQIFYHLLECVW